MILRSYKLKGANNMKIYIIKYPTGHTSIVSQDFWEREARACFKLNIEYVINNSKHIRELVVKP